MFFNVQVWGSPERWKTKTDPHFAFRLASRASAGGRCGSWCVAHRETLDRGDPSSDRRLSCPPHATHPSATAALSFHGETLSSIQPQSRHWIARMLTSTRDIKGLPRLRGAIQPISSGRMFTYFPCLESSLNVFVIATFHNINVLTYNINVLNYHFYSVITSDIPVFCQRHCMDMIDLKLVN